MNNDKLLSITDISKELGVEESTVRFYRNKFDKYIPSVGQGSARRYYAQSLDIFRFIQQAFDKKLNVLEIEDALSRPQRVNQHTLLQQQKALLVSVSTVFKQVQDLMQEMVVVIEDMNQARASFEQKEKELTERIERLEKQAKPIWKKWLGL